MYMYALQRTAGIKSTWPNKLQSFSNILHTRMRWSCLTIRHEQNYVTYVTLRDIFFVGKGAVTKMGENPLLLHSHKCNSSVKILPGISTGCVRAIVIEKDRDIDPSLLLHSF